MECSNMFSLGGVVVGGVVVTGVVVPKHQKPKIL